MRGSECLTISASSCDFWCTVADVLSTDCIDRVDDLIMCLNAVVDLAGFKIDDVQFTAEVAEC